MPAQPHPYLYLHILFQERETLTRRVTDGEFQLAESFFKADGKIDFGQLPLL